MGNPVLITIQKFIYLLDDLHYDEFAAHLSDTNATLPLKLVKTIRNKLPAFDTHEELCTKIYGSFEKTHKQNFNQLASYTFRLSAVLAQNYPNYLHHNILKIQRLINEGQTENAGFIADILLEIAQRTDDFKCSIFVLNFLSQQAFILKEVAAGMKLDEELRNALANEKTIIDIQVFTRKVLSDGKKHKQELEKIKDYLHGFSKHPSASIRMLASNSYLLVLYQFDLQAFVQPETQQIILQIEKDMHNQPHVVFPYLVDVRGSLFYMKLNSSSWELDSKEHERGFQALSAHYKSVKYWRNFVNMGDLYLITIQGTRLLNGLENILYLPDYLKRLSDKDAELIEDLTDKCQAFLKQGVNPARFEYEIMCYRLLLGIFHIFSGKNMKAGIDELEAILVEYPNLNTESDSAFLCLMLGYFALKDYEACSQTFKRYIKSIKDIPLFEGNDQKIHYYYYLSKWLSTGNKQSLVELGELSAKIKDHSSLEMLSGLKDYFKIPAV